TGSRLRAAPHWNFGTGIGISLLAARPLGVLFQPTLEFHVGHTLPYGFGLELQIVSSVWTSRANVTGAFADLRQAAFRLFLGWDTFRAGPFTLTPALGAGLWLAGASGRRSADDIDFDELRAAFAPSGHVLFGLDVSDSVRLALGLGISLPLPEPS